MLLSWHQLTNSTKRARGIVETTRRGHFRMKRMGGGRGVRGNTISRRGRRNGKGRGGFAITVLVVRLELTVSTFIPASEAISTRGCDESNSFGFTLTFCDPSHASTESSSASELTECP